MALLVLVGCAAPSPAGPASTLSAGEKARLEEEIRRVEESFNRSYERNDMDSYWTYYADDSSQLWDDGRVGMEQYRKEWTALLKAGGGVREIRMEDVQVRVSPAGDAAVASYRIFVRLKDAHGKESSGWYHESDVWFRQDGGWKLAYVHYSRVGPSPMPPGATGSGPPHASFLFRLRSSGAASRAAGVGPAPARSRQIQVW